MSLDALRAQLPEYAKDLRLNLESLLSGSGAPDLSPRLPRFAARQPGR
jgi:alkyl hydroperoxide reductase subunit D